MTALVPHTVVARSTHAVRSGVALTDCCTPVETVTGAVHLRKLYAVERRRIAGLYGRSATNRY
jgi:hypothetical protein